MRSPDDAFLNLRKAAALPIAYTQMLSMMTARHIGASGPGANSGRRSANSTAKLTAIIGATRHSR